MKLLTYLALLFACYSPNAFCEWIQLSSEENRISYVNTEVKGNYWIRVYSVMFDFSVSKEINISGKPKIFKSVIQEKTLDCLFGNVATRSNVFYSDLKGTGESFIPTDKSFANNSKPNQIYDYRWFQFNREYDDKVFEYVCGDLYTLRKSHLFWKIPRQSPM